METKQEMFVVQPNHPLNKKETQFLASLTPRETELHTLAAQMLGSSYFTGKTHGYTAWVKKNQATK
jgi:hypothetical protein